MAQLIGRKRLAMVAGASLSVVIAAGAFAYWTQSGSGTGSVDTGTTSPITVHQLNAPAEMYPGMARVQLNGNFDNPNDSKIYVESVSVKVDPSWSSRLVDAQKPACTAADFKITNAAGVENAPQPYNAEIDLGLAVGAWSGLYIQLLDTSANQDNCKNINEVPLMYDANAR